MHGRNAYKLNISKMTQRRKKTHEEKKFKVTWNILREKTVKVRKKNVETSCEEKLTKTNCGHKGYSCSDPNCLDSPL